MAKKKVFATLELDLMYNCSRANTSRGNVLNIIMHSDWSKLITLSNLTFNALFCNGVITYTEIKYYDWMV